MGPADERRRRRRRRRRRLVGGGGRVGDDGGDEDGGNPLRTAVDGGDGGQERRRRRDEALLGDGVEHELELPFEYDAGVGVGVGLGRAPHHVVHEHRRHVRAGGRARRRAGVVCADALVVVRARPVGRVIVQRARWLLVEAHVVAAAEIAVLGAGDGGVRGASSSSPGGSVLTSASTIASSGLRSPSASAASRHSAAVLISSPWSLHSSVLSTFASM